MSELTFDHHIFNREIPFCKVYSRESKEKLERIFLRNRISYFIEWQDKSFLQRIFQKADAKGKNVFTIRINEADAERARELVQGIESVKLRKMQKK